MSSKKHRGKSYLPFAFTEHGVTMLASILRSTRAVKMNIFIVRAFVTLRQFAQSYEELSIQLKEIREKVGDHDKNIIELYKAFETLLEEKQQLTFDWENRERIGFKRNEEGKLKTQAANSKTTDRNSKKQKSTPANKPLKIENRKIPRSRSKK